MKIDYLDVLFLPYMKGYGMTNKEAAKLLGMSAKTFGIHMKEGISTWPLNEILTLAKALRIPIETLREHIQYCV